MILAMAAVKPSADGSSLTVGKLTEELDIGSLIARLIEWTGWSERHALVSLSMFERRAEHFTS